MAWAIAYFLFGRVTLWVAMPFAISAFALLLENMIGGK
jgi:hypothetical protein